jgi:hypothetical protein
VKYIKETLICIAACLVLFNAVVTLLIAYMAARNGMWNLVAPACLFVPALFYASWHTMTKR